MYKALTRSQIDQPQTQIDKGYTDKFDSYDIVELIEFRYISQTLVGRIGTYQGATAAENDNNHIDLTQVVFTKEQLPAEILTLAVQLREKLYVYAKNNIEKFANAQYVE